MKLAAGVAAASLLMMQSSQMSPRVLLSDVRPLTDAEIAAVLDASQRAIAGKTFRLAAGSEILMGRGGVPRRIRWAGATLGGIVSGLASGSDETHRPTSPTWRVDYVIITDYTGRRARDCSGSVERGNMVVEYKLESSSAVWQINIRRQDSRDFGGMGFAPIFKMLQGAVALASGELKPIDGRPARALTAVWTPPGTRSAGSPELIGDPIPNMRGEPVARGDDKSIQSLWIDTQSLRPLRWEVTERGQRSLGFDFKYSSFKIPLPQGVHPPDCLR